MNKVEINKFHTALKNGSILILKEAVSYGYTRICINFNKDTIEDRYKIKDAIKDQYQKAKALLDAGLVDEIPKDEVESHGCLRNLRFGSEESKEQFINEHIFIKPNSLTFALVALNEIHEKKVEELQKKAREDKIELARQMVENILENTGVSLEHFED